MVASCGGRDGEGPRRRTCAVARPCGPFLPVELPVNTPSFASPDIHHVDSTTGESAALKHTAAILRELAAHDRQVNPPRGDIGRALAGLIDAVGRALHDVPDEVSRRSLAVASAVDRATGRRS